MANNENLTTVDQLEYLAQKSKTYTDKVKTDLAADIKKVDDKVQGIIATGGEANVIDEIKVNGVKVEPQDKVVDITVPTQESIEALIKIDEVKVNGTALIPNEKSVDITVPKTEDIQTMVDTAVAAADHLKRKVVESTSQINTGADDAEQYIYMVPKTNGDDGDGYDEYMVIEGELEKVGDWAVDLTDYVKKDMIATDEEVKAVIDPIFVTAADNPPTVE